MNEYQQLVDRAILRKATPMQVRIIEGKPYCPVNNHRVYKGQKYCPYCGQKLDWNKEE